jgi:phage shock protein A
MTKRSTSRRRSLSPAVEFVQLEIERVRDQVAKLERESSAHTRRCAELQAEIDVLKATVAIISSARTVSLAATKATSL